MDPRGEAAIHKVGTQHVIDERDLDAVTVGDGERLEVPEAWRTTFWGEPMPDIVGALRRSRQDH